MPTELKRQKRSADVIGNVIKIAQNATGEIEDTGKDGGKDSAAKHFPTPLIGNFQVLSQITLDA